MNFYGDSLQVFACDLIQFENGDNGSSSVGGLTSGVSSDKRKHGAFCTLQLVVIIIHKYVRQDGMSFEVFYIKMFTSYIKFAIISRVHIALN